jgi:hypothetical protein
MLEWGWQSALRAIPGVPRGCVGAAGGLRSRIWPNEPGRDSRPDLAEVKTSPMQAVSVATALIGRGLPSERYVAKVGAFSPRSEKFRYHNLTLIERDALDASTLPDGSHLPPEEARRNWGMSRRASWSVGCAQIPSSHYSKSCCCCR